MEIIRSKYAGACYGVNRALSILDNAIEGSRVVCGAEVDSVAGAGSIAGADSVAGVGSIAGADSVAGVGNVAEAGSDSVGDVGIGSDMVGSCEIYTLGPLIHNPQVTRELRSRGVKEADSINDINSGIMVIRSHGVALEVIEQAERKGLIVMDATCPHVTKAQVAARQLKEQGYLVLIVGELGHPEVEGIRAYAGNQAIVAQEPRDLPEAFESDNIGIVVQTTQTESSLELIVRELVGRGFEPVVRDTICFATKQRQEAAIELAGNVDAMVVVGGRNSGNTTRLAQLCTKVCRNTHHIESAEELDPAWFVGVGVVGITAGASTPENQIIAVEKTLENLL